MTYLNFLLLFLGLPLAGLAALHLRDWRRPPAARAAGRPARRVALLVVAVHSLIALVYTTPWDNYLVATGVWYYDPALVLGITFGWVPLEEYLFFILQPLFTGLWLVWLLPRLGPAPEWRGASDGWPAAARRSGVVVVVLWLAALIALLSGWGPANYLSLLLVWALPPLLLQLVVGADILWRYRRPALAALLSATLYLCAADVVAIGAGTWTISPAHSFNFLIWGLPVEEVAFFFMTNTLIVSGITLALAPETLPRLAGWLARLRRGAPANTLSR